MGPSTQLLVLADHPKLQQLYAHRLREHGFRVDVASGIEEGIVAAIVLRPRLIIAEWLLKDGHGLELVRRLRGVAAGAAIPILFLTDEAALPMTVHRVSDGPIDYLPKPFSFEQLVQKVERWLAALPPDVGLPAARLPDGQGQAGGAQQRPNGETAAPTAPSRPVAAAGASSGVATAPAARSPLAQKTQAVIDELVESGLLRRRERAHNGGPE